MKNLELKDSHLTPEYIRSIRPLILKNLMKDRKSIALKKLRMGEEQSSSRSKDVEVPAMAERWSDLVEREECNQVEQHPPIFEKQPPSNILCAQGVVTADRGNLGKPEALIFSKEDSQAVEQVCTQIKFGSFIPSPSSTFLSVGLESGVDAISPPQISITSEQNEQLCKPWRDSLIIRLWGLILPPEFLTQKLLRLWKLKAEPFISGIGQGFFLISFKLAEDRWRALLSGPNFIDGHFMSIQLWSPRFNPSLHTRSAYSPVWVRLENLPLEFYDQEILVRVGNALGTFIGLDADTHDLSKTKFARICVLTNIGKRLPNSICIDDFQQSVMFEGSFGFCFWCGNNGHIASVCKLGQRHIPAKLISGHQKADQTSEWTTVGPRKKKLPFREFSNSKNQGSSGLLPMLDKSSVNSVPLGHLSSSLSFSSFPLGSPSTLGPSSRCPLKVNRSQGITEREQATNYVDLSNPAKVSAPYAAKSIRSDFVAAPSSKISNPVGKKHASSSDHSTVSTHFQCTSPLSSKSPSLSNGKVNHPLPHGDQPKSAKPSGVSIDNKHSSDAVPSSPSKFSESVYGKFPVSSELIKLQLDVSSVKKALYSMDPNGLENETPHHAIPHPPVSDKQGPKDQEGKRQAQERNNSQRMVRDLPENSNGDPCLQLLQGLPASTESFPKARVVPLPVSVRALQRPSSKADIPFQGLGEPDGGYENAGTVDAVLGKAGVGCSVQSSPESGTEGLHGCVGSERPHPGPASEYYAGSEYPSGDKRSPISSKTTGGVLREYHGANSLDSERDATERSIHNNFYVSPNRKRVRHVLYEARNRNSRLHDQGDPSTAMGVGDTVFSV
ncbi:hypothetical protein G2W53_030664 [Senna tora]|uniref:CCHC-type domain-containing protein n=1 Tax=Senna tora TaxID=362788 RepID=A0A834WB07_9FABA|nr:hypothetical protein G2W53_030664 [Senna tora]